MGNKVKSPVETIKWWVFLICSTPSSSWRDASTICHPRDSPQSPKVTQNTIKITQFGWAIFFMGKEGIIKSCLSDLSYSITLFDQCITHLSLHGPPIRAPNATKNNTTKTTRICLAIFFKRKEGAAPLQVSKILFLWFVLPIYPHGLELHPFVIPGASLWS